MTTEGVCPRSYVPEYELSHLSSLVLRINRLKEVLKEHTNPTEAGLFIRLSDISLPRWQENYADVLKDYAESLAIRQQELQRITEFDHVQAFKRVKNWGKYGWVVMGRALADMEIYEVTDVPTCEAEADERMLTRLNGNRLQTLVETLKDDLTGTSLITAWQRS